MGMWEDAARPTLQGGRMGPALSSLLPLWRRLGEGVWRVRMGLGEAASAGGRRQAHHAALLAPPLTHHVPPGARSQQLAW